MESESPRLTVRLTARQDQIVAMLELYPRKTIADRLKTNQQNVDQHIQRAKQQMGLKDATDAMLVAHMLLNVRPG